MHGMKTDLQFPIIDDGPLFSHVRHVVVHALLLRPLARLVPRHRRHEELRRAVAVALDLLQRGLQQAVGHLVPVGR
jgi:hypothetical protein